MSADPKRKALLEAVAHRYYAPLVSFFRKRTRNACEVDDLVQQVFLRLAQYPEIAHIHNPSAYLFQTAANTLKDHYKYKAVRDRFSGEMPAAPDAAASDFSPERVLQGRQSLERVAHALRHLPERTRDVLILRCFEGLKYAEIARLQGISVRAIEKHMVKALAHLSEALEESTEPDHARERHDKRSEV